MTARQARIDDGEKPRGKVPTPPSPEPQPKDQYNFTDAESRIMKTGGGFEQCYNAQAVVEVESRLIVGERVSQAANDKQELVPTVAATIGILYFSVRLITGSVMGEPYGPRTRSTFSCVMSRS